MVTNFAPGIAPENLANLFDCCLRLEKGNNHISGLGLYIPAAIIRAHGGEMGVEGELGEGATFWVTIPDDHAIAGPGEENLKKARRWLPIPVKSQRR